MIIMIIVCDNDGNNNYHIISNSTGKNNDNSNDYDGGYLQMLVLLLCTYIQYTVFPEKWICVRIALLKLKTKRQNLLIIRYVLRILRIEIALALLHVLVVKNILLLLSQG